MGIIFYSSSQPSEVSLQASGELLVQINQLKQEEIYNTTDSRVFQLHYYIRKFAHFVLYSGLGFLMVFSVILLKGRSYFSYIISWLAASLYGVLDEVHQYFVPGRGPSIADVKLDAISALAGVGIAVIIIKFYRKYGPKKR